MRSILKWSSLASAVATALALANGGRVEGKAAAEDIPVVPLCADLPSPVYIAGSSAVGNVLAILGGKLSAATPPTTLVYIKGAGSCDGVNAIVSGLKVSAGPNYWDANGNKADCALPSTGVAVDLGLSDVFPSSCPDITPDLLTGVGDFAGPVQSMNIVVPKGATQSLISAEAAYLTFGLGKAGKTDWNNPALFAIRNFQSGTETMIAKAINVPTNKWLGTDANGSSGVVTAITNATDLDRTIGILASNEADQPANRLNIKRLAFQPYGETCALYPDSDYSSHDKANVRTGKYQIWGPLHMLAKVDDQNVPTDQKAKDLLDILLGNTAISGVDVTAIETDAFTVPQCAMKVSRSEELGKPKAFSPDGACGCFFEFKTTGTASSGCKACTTAAQCTAAAPLCNHGYCEVK
jgi:hypothetical protein